MKVDKVDNVDEVAVSRGLFIASFSAFIFTSLFSIAVAGAGFFGGASTATAYYSNYTKSGALAQTTTATAAKPTVTLTVTPSSIPSGVSTSVKLVWKSTNATKCLVKKNGVMFIDNLLNGEAPVSQYGAATFSIDCTGAGGTATASAPVTVATNPQVVASGSIIATTNPIPYNDKAKFTVKTTGYKDCYIQTPAGVKYPIAPINTSESGPLTNDTLFALYCTNAQTNVSSKVSEVNVKVLSNVAIAQGPTSVTIAANPTKVTLNGSTAVSFTLTPNLTGCLITKSNAQTQNAPFLKPEFSRTDGIQSGALTSDTTFTITCTGKVDKKEYKAQTLVIVDKTPVVQKVLTQLNVTPTTVSPNGVVMVSWTSKYADSCVLSKSNYDAAGKIVNKTTISTLQYGSNLSSGQLTQTTKFMLECKNSAGTEVSFVDVKVGTTPVVALTANITANPMIVAQGGTTNISWTSTGADVCTVYSDVYTSGGTKTWKTGLSGQNIVSLPVNKDIGYQLSCIKSGKTVSSFVLIKTKPAAVELTAKITADPMIVAQGSTTNISWTSTGADFCNVYENDGNTLWKTGLTGTKIQSTPITKARQYTLSCSKAGKTVASSVTIGIKVAPPPTGELTAEIFAEPNVVNVGQTTNITWKSTGASFCNVYENDGNTLWKTGLSGTKVVTTPLTKVRQYTLSCSKNGTTIARSVTIAVKAGGRPTATITSSASTVKAGGSVNITWKSTGADKCTLMKGTSPVSTQNSGTISTGPLNESTVYWLMCQNSAGSYSAATSIQVL